MARPLRIEFEGALYHVTARGNERRKVYFTETDYKRFLEYVKQAAKKHGIVLHCYVLMSNHYHLIIETPETNLSKVMHHINSSYTAYINRKRNRAGHLFQGRYKAIAVDKDSYLLELSRYIHLNPVRAGIVERPQDYPWSSYKTYISRSSDEILTEDLILGMISGDKGKARKEYRTYVESAIGREIENPFRDVYGGMILGNKQFIKDILKRIKSDHLNKEDISHRKALNVRHGVEEIIDIVVRHFKTSKEELLGGKPSEMKKISMYLMKMHTGMTNRSIGEVFRVSYSAAAKLFERFRKDLETTKRLRNKVNKIERELSNVSG